MSLFTKSKETIKRVNEDLQTKKKIHRRRFKNRINSTDDESSTKLNAETKIKSIKTKMDRYRSN